jgi:hypothetical protein
VAKYVALCSTKGYAIGRKFVEWMETRLADAEADEAQLRQGLELLGHSEDVLAICGSRMYVFYLDAAPTERLVSQTGSLLTYLEEEDDLQAEGGGKLRKSILTGCGSPACMAAVRTMALICDAVLWPLLRKKNLKVSHGGSGPQWLRSQEPMARSNGDAPRLPARTAERATRALPRPARPRCARRVGNAHMHAFPLTCTLSMRIAPFHAHCTPWRAQRACSRTSSVAVARCAPLAPARSANTRAGPLRSAQQAAPRIAAASRVLSSLRRDPSAHQIPQPPVWFFKPREGGGNNSGLGASAPFPRLAAYGRC